MRGIVLDTTICPPARPSTLRHENLSCIEQLYAGKQTD